jgi:putative lipoprotein (rSAM/lipoprotein system)
MKKIIIKFFDKIILLLLGFSGIAYTSCEYGAVEYGVPHGQYEFKGVITDKETSNPIQNIQVVRQYGDTIYADAEGKFAFPKAGSNFYMGSEFHLKVEDIDGEENGGDFETQEMDIKFTKADQVEKGDGSWYEGKFVKTQNIELKRKDVHIPLYGVPQSTFKP